MEAADRIHIFICAYIPTHVVSEVPDYDGIYYAVLP
jgi:hypothetical protein